MFVLRWIGVRFFGLPSRGLAGVLLAMLAATSWARGGISYLLTDLSNPLGVPGGVGRAFTSRAYLYDNGMVTHLGVTGFANSYAQGINDRGQVVGWLTNADDSGSGGFLYSDGATYNLNDLLVNAPGYSITDAFGINDSGQIIAEANIPSKFPIDDAVLLTPISTPTAIALPPAAWAAISAIPLLFFGKRIRRAIR